MFIDLTRYGGVRAIRVAVTAIAYIDAVDCGAAVHLIGGESLRVNEDPMQIEERIDATIALSPIAIKAGIAPCPLAAGEPVLQHPLEPDPALKAYLAQRGSFETRRRKGKAS